MLLPHSTKLSLERDVAHNSLENYYRILVFFKRGNT